MTTSNLKGKWLVDLHGDRTGFIVLMLYIVTKIHFYFGIGDLLLSISIMFSILFFVPSLIERQ
jgi:hypothetical protein